MKIFLTGFLALALALVPTLAIAQAHPIIGTWKLRSTSGHPCDLILDLEYGFHPDSVYTIRSVMRVAGSRRELSAKGSYELEDGTITGYVEGSTVGPFRYRFDSGDLILVQPSPRCEIRLKK